MIHPFRGNNLYHCAVSIATSTSRHHIWTRSGTGTRICRTKFQLGGRSTLDVIAS